MEKPRSASTEPSAQWAAAPEGDFSFIPTFPPDHRPATSSQQPPSSRAAEPVSESLAIAPVDHPAEREAEQIARGLSGSAPAAATEVTPPAAGASRGVATALAGAGRPLDASSREFFEARLQHDFSHVRIHDDARAAQSAEQLHANAYTVGHHIAFAAGSYAPQTSDGRALLAHELAHVAQSARLGPHLLMRDTKVPAAQRYWDASKIKQRVQALDTSANKELSKLIQGSDLYGNQSLAWTSRPAGGPNTDWQITVAFDKKLDPSGATRGETTTSDVSAATATKPAVKLITIRLNPDATPTTEENTLYQSLNDKDKRHRLIAVTLLHELMHARITIGRSADASGSTPASDTLDSLDKARLQSTTTAAAERAAVVGQVVALVKFGDKTLRNEAQAASQTYTTPPIIDSDVKIRAFANATPDDMVEEKFAKQRSSNAEGLKTVTNNVVADAYGDKVDKTIRSFFQQPNSLSSNQLFSTEIQNLKTMLEKFFDAIDKPPAATTPPPAASGSTTPPTTKP